MVPAAVDGGAAVPQELPAGDVEQSAADSEPRGAAGEREGEQDVAEGEVQDLQHHLRRDL